jgi:hypothetical protein
MGLIFLSFVDEHGPIRIVGQRQQYKLVNAQAIGVSINKIKYKAFIDQKVQDSHYTKGAEVSISKFDDLAAW